MRLDLIAALHRAGDATAAEHELGDLPANLATDDRTKRARAQLGFAKALDGAPGEQTRHRTHHQPEQPARPPPTRCASPLAADSVDALDASSP
ncbi:MAG: hypothetical protein IPH76_08220 [Xanthomonadales bacterium]|nr:hypothetical protein [Xanthomonadales bacterium]